jgi:hypothetical protein
MICFVHIERAGGTTLHAIFRQNDPIGFLTLTPWHYWSNEDGSELTVEEVRWLVRCLPFTTGIGGHTTRSYMGYEAAIGGPVKYVTFLREPIARYISHYNYQINEMGKDWTIETFLAERRFDNYMTKRIAGKFDVEEAKRRLADQFSFVGLTERFDESLLLMKAELSIPRFNTLYTKENASINPSYRKDPRLRTPEIQQRIRECNLLDIELYQFLKRELYPRYVARFVGDLDRAVEEQKRERAGYRFHPNVRAMWLAHRHLWYRHIEHILHRRFGGTSGTNSPHDGP